MNSTIALSQADGKSQRDMGGMFCAALFILLGGLCLNETTKMLDPDSYVFPRMIISGLMGLSLLLIGTSLWHPPRPVSVPDSSAGKPSGVRRCLLVVSMMGAALLMPFIGFILSGLGVFMTLMVLANYDPWSKSKVLLFTFVGVAIVVGFYGGFTYLLQVSLPEGSWMQVS